MASNSKKTAKSPRPEKGRRYTPDEKAMAEFLFVIEGKNKTEVAAAMATSLSTINRWAKKGKWDEKRGLEVISGPYLARLLREDTSRTVLKAKEENRPMTAGERDGVLKNQKVINDLDKGAVFASHGIQVMTLFQAFLSEAAPDLRAALAPHMVEFTDRLTKRHI